MWILCDGDTQWKSWVEVKEKYIVAKSIMSIVQHKI